MIRIIAIFALILAIGQASGAQYIAMDPHSVIPVTLSSNNHNRIGICGDRVKKAYFKSGNISVDVEEDSGQLFIQSLRMNCPDTTLSVVSNSGTIQDLKLHFADICSEIVLLQPAGTLANSTEVSNGTVVNVLEQDSLAALVNGFVSGVLPEGYLSIEDQDKPFKTRCGLKMQRLSRLVNKELIVFVYRVENPSCKVIKVTECKVNVLDGDWVFLDRYELKPRECGLVLIGCLR